MSIFSIATALARLGNKFRRGTRRGESQSSMSAAFWAPNCEPGKHIIKRPLAPSPISVLNDDVLLHIFYIHRLHIGDEQDILAYPYHLRDCRRWWYDLAHVSRWWRRIILAAPSLLDLHLVCTCGVPVADLLAHSPPLPITICYLCTPLNGYMMTAKDINGVFLAFSHRDRVHHVALYLPSSVLEKLFVAMDGQFPNLERLNIASYHSPGVTLPQTFGAPNLFHVELTRVALPLQCPLLITTGLVFLLLRNIPESGYFPPSYLLTSLSLMPQLEILWIKFDYSVLSNIRDTEITCHVTLPNLREFKFWGIRAHLEGLCARMTTPVLSVFHVQFSGQLTYDVPDLLWFIQTSEDLHFQADKLIWGGDHVRLREPPQQNPFNYPLNLLIWCNHLDAQISSTMQILDALSSVLSVAEQVTLIVNRCFGLHDVVSRTQWRGLLRPLRNAKVLRVVTDVGGCGLGRSLHTEGGEQPLELLPNLEEVSYSGSDDENAFTLFVNEREAVGRPVRLTPLNWWVWSGRRYQPRQLLLSWAAGFLSYNNCQCQ
jgi:hypothetical protein